MQNQIPSCETVEQRRQELSKILNEMETFENKENIIKKAIALSDVTKNLIISLLKNDLGHIIPLIYKSPCLLFKLADAGFETDPRKRDSTGKSAFFYALKTGELQLVSHLYDHAANACLRTDASVRSPDSLIIENLEDLENHLRLLEPDLEIKEVGEESRRFFRDLRHFNKFQIDLSNRIIGIEFKYSNCSKEERGVRQRKEIILTILKTYKTYFNYFLPSGDENDVSLFQEYCEHRYYFDKLDLISAVMFFDNLFLLKERWGLPSDAYLHIESQFFLHVFWRKYIEKYEKNFDLGSRWIAFQERLSLQRQVCSFENILEETEEPKKPFKKTVLTLTNLPQIYGEFLVSRLQHYLNTAVELTVDDIKSVLVLERCLQVIGECCKDIDFKSVQGILTLGFPSDFIRHLKQIRNHLTHYKSQNLQCKYNLEQDMELFKGIQNELSKFTKLLMPIYSAHKYKMDQYLLLHSVESVRRVQERNKMKEYDNELKNMDDFLNKEINNLNFYGNDLNSKCKYIVQNILYAIESELKSLKEIIGKSEDPLKAVKKPSKHSQKAGTEQTKGLIKELSAVKKLDFCFWCLEEFLTCLTKDKILTCTQKKRESLFTRLERNPMLLQKTNKSTDSNSERTSSASQKIENPISPYNKHGFYVPSNRTVSARNKQQVSQPKPRYGESQVNVIEENHASSAEAIRTPSRDDLPMTNSILHSQINDEEEDPTEIFENTIETFLEDYKKLKDTLFQESQEDIGQDFNFENIENYCWRIKGHKSLSKTEKEVILQSVPEKYQNAPELKRKVKDLLKVEAEFTREIEDGLSKLNLKNNDIKQIKENFERGLTDEAILIVDLAMDYFLDLKNKIELKEIGKREYELLCEKLEIPDEAKDILFTIVSGTNKKLESNKFEFVLNRIKLLKNILLVENTAISQLRERNKRMHVKEKMVQLYLTDSAVQASVETLLFDCMVILDTDDLESLRRKTANLLNGINLRNVLAHGNPLLESLGRLLDPCDLPSELVEKMLKLISDEHLIECLQRILELSPIGCNDFMELLEEESLIHLRDEILKYDYHQYASLIKIRDDRHREEVVSS